jgi:predicted phage baseplate assembly protein
MSLPAPNLDDLRFQSDLVDEARKRIVNYCPEWTDYNVSDPGITMIELFAWMTELMVYRLNRVPEKNFIKFLDMLGLQPMPASSARTELTFWLSTRLPFSPEDKQTVIVPQGFEVRSGQTENEVVFTIANALEIVPPLLAHVRKEGEFNRNFLSRMGLETFYSFDQQTPRQGDTFYLGFSAENDLCGHTLQLIFSCDPTEAVGIRREDPPWVWECQGADGNWQELKLSNFEGEKDTTGGLNNPEGQLVLYLPLTFKPASLYGLEAFWLRCRIEQRNPLQGMYSETPRIKKIEAFTLGATIPAMHSTRVEGEILGVSSGEPGQSFTLSYSPVLSLAAEEKLEVQETRDGELVYVPWQQVNDFSQSTRFDRHYVLDMASGTVRFGPSVRQPDASVAQYGRVPESGRTIRFSHYRYGGGVSGNLPPGSLTTVSAAVAYVARVSNLVRAAGGRDQENLDELKMRAQRELQAQRRAVTAQDYEQFTRNFSRGIARARCLTPNDNPTKGSGSVAVLVVPAVAESLKAGVLSALHLDAKLQTDLRSHLDQYRLLTTPLTVREPRYMGVKVKARVVPQDYINPAEVIQRVNEELQRYLTPLRLDERLPLLQTSESWDGWEFGRDLFTAEIISLIQQVPSVKFVLDVEISYRSIVPVEEGSIFEDATPVPLKLVDKVLRVPPDGLICSLTHEIDTATLESVYLESKE